MNEAANICVTAVEKNSPETRKYKMEKQNSVVAKTTTAETTMKPLTVEVCVPSFLLRVCVIHHSAAFHLKRICEHVPRVISIEK